MQVNTLVGRHMYASNEIDTRPFCHGWTAATTSGLPLHVVKLRLPKWKSSSHALKTLETKKMHPWEVHDGVDEVGNPENVPVILGMNGTSVRRRREEGHKKL